MEVVQQQFLAFMLFIWQLINFRMQALFDESLEAERTRTRTRAAEKKTFLELIQDATDETDGQTKAMTHTGKKIYSRV